MSTGPRRLQFNNLERAISNDHNRAQAFLARAQQQRLRAQHNDRRLNYRLYPGVSTPVTNADIPAAAEVYSGLFVRPDAASYLTVDPGVASFLVPDYGGSDDSPYVYCDDAGCGPGVLNFAGNGTPSTVRWDVVECRPYDVVVESSNRDQYNPATGLFTPVSVPKVSESRLEYRIRQGTPGGGWPGSALGWTPLAVVAVREGALSFAQCDLWDVRPLVEDRTRPQTVGALVDGLAPRGETQYTVRDQQFWGFAESEFNGYLAGGALQATSCFPLANFGDPDPATGGSAPALTIGPAANDSGVVFSSDALFYVAALFPRDPVTGSVLPRWARYSQLPDPSLGRRVPNGTRGILVLTSTAPNENGFYNSLPLPSTTQLTNVSGAGVCLGISSAAGFTPASGVYSRGRYQHAVMIAQTGTGPWTVAPTEVTADKLRWSLTWGVHYPPNAKAIIVSFGLSATYSVNFDVIEVRSLEGSGSDVRSSYRLATNRVPGDGPQTAVPVRLSPVSVPRPLLRQAPYPPLAGSYYGWNIDLFVNFSDGSRVLAFGKMFIHGWEF